MTNTLIDNTEIFKLADILKKYIAQPDIYKEICIATGYWDIPGTALVINELKKFLAYENHSLRLLIGSDPIVRAYQLKNPIKDGKFPDDYFRRDLSELEVTEPYLSVVEALQQYCDQNENQSRIKVRIFKRDENGDAQFLHAKCYIFIGATESAGIIGSSNFTKKGLEDNAELNYLETNTSVVTSEPKLGNVCKGHICWFDQIWEQSEPWNYKFLEEVLKPSNLGKKAKERAEQKFSAITPYELYIKYLQLLFGSITDANSDAILRSYLPPSYTPFEYQLDAVKQSFFILQQHGGFFLADVVGLGKTVTGMLIIKKFLMEAQSVYRRHPLVLVVTPPAIKSGWEKTLKEFDSASATPIAPNVKFITTGSIGKLSDDFEIDEEYTETDSFDENLQYNDYGMILIDESHNFRHANTQKYQALNNLIGQIKEKTAQTPFIGLISATPQNNSPADLKNQIYLFEREPNESSFDTVDGGKLDTFFSTEEKIFRHNKNTANSPESKEALFQMAQEIRNKVLNEIVVRRTRTDIKKHYSKDGTLLKFPEVKGPHKLEYKMDSELCELFYDTMNAIWQDPEMPNEEQDTDRIGFYRYCAIMYFKSEENRKRYKIKNLDVKSISRQLERMMQILLVKRLESSFKAFKTSLHNLLDYTQNMVCMWEQDEIFICPDVDINKEFKDAEKYNGSFEIVAANIRKRMTNKDKERNREFHCSDFEDQYIELLRQDIKLISKLCKRWDANEYDPKMDAFKENLNTLFDPQINNPHKFDKPRLVIFTEALDTAKELARIFNAKKHKALCISSTNRVQEAKAIAENFDAQAKNQRDDYDVIITTEVLAEGVNLHRANIILNYDTPWNATRLMQRIGRVNRIGSKEDCVHVFNFYPSTEGNSQIRLIESAYAKIQAFHTMFGEDNRVFSEMEEISNEGYSPIIDGEETPYAKFIAELKNYKDGNPERFAMLSKMDLHQVGGSLPSRDKDQPHLVLVRSEEGKECCVALYPEDKARIISQLSFMELLECKPSATFYAEDRTDKEQILKEAIEAFNEHITRHITAADTKGKRKEALKLIHSLSATLKDSDARAAVKKVRNAVEAGDTFIIHEFLKNEDRLKNPSLFGPEGELSLWLTSTFSHIAEKANNKAGKAEIALYELANN